MSGQDEGTLEGPWAVLGIAPSVDPRAIRRAYAQALKAMDVDADVEGYTRLREARDIALRRARMTGKAPEAAVEPTDAPLSAVPVPASQSAPRPVIWAHAAPDLQGDWNADHALSTSALAPRVEDGFEGVFFHVPADSGTGEALPLAAGAGLSAPVLEGYGPLEAAIGLKPGQTCFERLTELLGPIGASGNADPLGPAEQGAARRALATVLSEARSADVARQLQIETWLLEKLAGTWPRSTPLLETAAQALCWSEEAGRVDSRPLVQFVMARLRGQRFIAHVERPDHRFHKAWSELSRPGSTGPLRLLRARSSDIEALLHGIRRRFPEVEDRLDPARVASWERSSGWGTGILVVLGFILLAILIAVLEPDRRIGSPASPDSGSTLPLSSDHTTKAPPP